MKTQSKTIVVWADSDLLKDVNLEAISHFLKTRYEVLITDSYKELLAYCQQRNPIAALIVDENLQSSTEALQHLKLQFPELLRFVASADLPIDTLTHLYEQNLIHKHIRDQKKPELLEIQLQETSALIQIVCERNKFLELSITDPVTQLTNHRFFQQRLRQELHKAKTHKDALSLIMIDVDHFKLLNDQFGHPKGDSVLAVIAKTIKDRLPAPASVSRYGGEEFAVIVPKCTAKRAYEIAEDIRLSIVNIHAIDFRLSISLGVASYPEHGLDADEILALADQALYYAKRQGRNITIVAGDSSY